MSDNIKRIGLLTSTSLVVASMIGTGVFTSLGFQVMDIKTGFAIILLWVIGGIDAFCGATVYAELGSAFPRSGGEYSLLSRLIHPSIGFVAGWVSATVGFAAPASIAAIALASYLKAIFANIPENHVAAGIIVLFSVIHASSINYGTRFQNVTTITKALLMALLILTGLIIGNESIDIQLFPTSRSWSEIISGPFAVALVFVSYAYTGWNSSIYIVGEIDKPRNLVRSLFMGTGLVMFLYVLVNYVFLATVPIAELEGQIEIGFLAGRAIFGHQGGVIMALVISLLLLSTVSAYVFLGPRIMQIMGQDFKALGWFSKTSEKGIPVNAFIFSTILSITFIYTSTFDEVLLYTSFLLILITTITVSSVFVLRIKHTDIKASYRAWGYPFTPLLFLSLNTWILSYLMIEKPYESLVALIVFVVGLMLYFITRTASSR